MEEKNEKETLRKELATTTKNLDPKLKEMEEAKKKIEDLQRDLETKTNENDTMATELQNLKNEKHRFIEEKKLEEKILLEKEKSKQDLIQMVIECYNFPTFSQLIQKHVAFGNDYPLESLNLECLSEITKKFPSFQPLNTQSFCQETFNYYFLELKKHLFANLSETYGKEKSIFQIVYGSKRSKYMQFYNSRND